MHVLRIVLITALLLTSNSFAQSGSSIYAEATDLMKEGKNAKAIKKYEEALALAESDNDSKLQMDCHMQLAELKNTIINYKSALAHYQSFSKLYKLQVAQEKQVLKQSVNELENEVEEVQETIVEKNSAIDSLSSEQLRKQLKINSLAIENQQKEIELNKAEYRKNRLILALLLAAAIAVFILVMYFQKKGVNKTLKSKNSEIVAEKDKSDKLLLNILPKKVAEELKEHGKTTSRKYEMATVMFTDFKGFTEFSEKNTPENIVDFIDYYFRAFDRIMEKHNIEKIKTIGDAYLCVSGIPNEDPNHVINMLNAAFEIQEFVHKTMKEGKRTGGDFLEMRIGIHCGPLVAGVVGAQKFAYDVWGDTVNIAARMEQSGALNVINVSETVYRLAKNQFDFEYRGEVEAKNKGRMKMYFVTKID